MDLIFIAIFAIVMAVIVVIIMGSRREDYPEDELVTSEKLEEDKTVTVLKKPEEVKKEAGAVPQEKGMHFITDAPPLPQEAREGMPPPLPQPEPAKKDEVVLNGQMVEEKKEEVPPPLPKEEKKEEKKEDGPPPPPYPMMLPW